MKPVFADTHDFITLFNPSDEYHGIAEEISDRLTSPILTTEFILVEFGNFARLPVYRADYVELLHSLEDDDEIDVLPCSSRLMREGLDLFERRPDKEWSLTDCIFFAVMEAEGIRDALTADRHFEQAGFNVLLKLEDE